MAVSEREVVEALRAVRDVEGRGDLVTARQVRGIKVFEGAVSLEIAAPGGGVAGESREKLRQEIEAAVSRLTGVSEVFVGFTTHLGTAPAPAAAGAAAGGAGRPQQAPTKPPAPRGLPGVKHIVAVGAGKGGVGKSTVALNLAIGLALGGKKVALLDGDIYGPSIPTLTGIGPRPPQIAGDRIIPFRISAPQRPEISLAVMSIGFMVDREKALIWRGPMAHGAMKQLIEQVEWTGAKQGDQGGPAAGEGLDYLIVDLPPGTGDVSLTLAQTVPLTGAVIVATPQEVALADARRAVRMFQQLGVEILGVVENMSYFVCEHGGQYDIFGRGGAHTMAQQMGLPFLGEIPIDVLLRRNSDAGTPFGNFAEASPSRGPIMAVAEALDKQVAVRLATRPGPRSPEFKIS